MFFVFPVYRVLYWLDFLIWTNKSSFVCFIIVSIQIYYHSSYFFHILAAYINKVFRVLWTSSPLNKYVRDYVYNCMAMNSPTKSTMCCLFTNTLNINFTSNKPKYTEWQLVHKYTCGLLTRTKMFKTHNKPQQISSPNSRSNSNFF